MNWSMPRPVLQVVAAVLAVACLGSFILGLATAPSRGRLPGQGAAGVGGEVLEAQEATPLVDERIKGLTAEEEELTPEEKAKREAEAKAKAEAAALAKAEAEKGAPAPPPTLPLPTVTPAEKTEPSQPKAEPKLEEPVF
jgi:hypothetical protein